MTEENQDSKIPKLRLSRKAEDAQPEETKPKETPAPKPEVAAVPKPNLQIKRPGGETKQTSPTSKETTETKPEPQDEPAFDPKKPFKGIAKAPEKEEGDTSPPELPNKPVPAVDNESGEKIEEAINQIGDEHKGGKSKGGLVTSIVIILVLLAVLGGAGYGLYYVLKSPDETGESVSTVTPESADTEEDSGGFLSGPIAKAKAVIAQKTENDASAAEDADLQEELAAPAQAAEEPAVEATETSETAETAETAETTQGSAAVSAGAAVAEFLRTAHISGVRTGVRPLLIMNGENYKQGDLINPEYGLRFIGIRDEKLAFRDDKGIIYIKSF